MLLCTETEDFVGVSEFSFSVVGILSWGSLRLVWNRLRSSGLKAGFQGLRSGYGSHGDIGKSLFADRVRLKFAFILRRKSTGSKMKSERKLRVFTSKQRFSLLRRKNKDNAACVYAGPSIFDKQKRKIG